MSTRFLTGIVIASMTAIFWGQQVIASDASELYSGRAYCLGSSANRYGYYQKPSHIYFGAWSEVGVYTNAHGSSLNRRASGYLPAERFVQESGNSRGLGNLQNPHFNMNQLGLFLEKKMNTTCGFDWGFKAQAMFGTDAYLTQSREDFSLDYDWRSGDYYTSISDLYLTAGYCNLDVKVGKFASPLSYEHVESPNNFFYSHSYGFLQSPDTHSGVLLDYQIACPLSVYAGWTTGSDAGWKNRFGDSAVLAGVKAKLWEGGTLSYGMQYANIHGGMHGGDTRFSKMYDDDLRPTEKMNAYYHSMVFTQNLGCNLDYAAEWYYMRASHLTRFFNRNNDPFSRYGIAQYLTYQMTCKFGIGFRGEWMHNGYREVDSYGLTFGANWAPVQCLMIRPEIRYDWCQGQRDRYFNNGNNREQLSGGVSVMYKF